MKFVILTVAVRVAYLILVVFCGFLSDFIYSAKKSTMAAKDILLTMSHYIARRIVSFVYVVCNAYHQSHLAVQVLAA